MFHRGRRAKAGLDLASYAGILRGSTSGEILAKGDPDDSYLYLCMSHQEEPAMPPGKDRLDEEILEEVRIWIASGMPEKASDISVAEMNDVSTPMTLAPKAMTDNEQETQGSPQMAKASSGITISPVFKGATQAPITALAVSPNGKMAAVGGQLQVLLFDVNQSELIGVLPFPEGEVFELQFGNNGKELLASGGVHAESGKVVIRDLKTGQRVRELGDEYDVVLGAAFDPKSQTAFLGGPDRVVKVIDVESNQLRATLTKHTDWVLEASFNREGLIFATADRAGNVFVWETETAAELHTLRGHRGSVTAIDWSIDGDFCMTAGEDGTVRVWNMHTGEQVRQWTAHDKGALSLTTTTNDQVVTTGRDRFVKIWSLKGDLQQEIQLDLAATEVSVAPDLATSDLEKIDQTIAMVPNAIAYREVETASEQPPSDNVLASNEIPQEPSVIATQGHERLTRVAEELQRVIEEMKKTEQEIAIARAEFVESQQKLAHMSAAERLADDRTPHGNFSEVDTLRSLVATLEKAQRLSDSLDETSTENLDSIALTRISHEKAKLAMERALSGQKQFPTSVQTEQAAQYSDLKRDFDDAKMRLNVALQSWASLMTQFRQLNQEMTAVNETFSETEQLLLKVETELNDSIDRSSKRQDTVDATSDPQSVTLQESR